MKPIEIVDVDPIEIDWSKPQWLQHENDETLLVLTTGENFDSEFTGMVLPHQTYENGQFLKTWKKRQFRRLRGAIKIIISN